MNRSISLIRFHVLIGFRVESLRDDERALAEDLHRP
jgi:hypothetical protein